MDKSKGRSRSREKGVSTIKSNPASFDPNKAQQTIEQIIHKGKTDYIKQHIESGEKNKNKSFVERYRPEREKNNKNLHLKSTTSHTSPELAKQKLREVQKGKAKTEILAKANPEQKIPSSEVLQAKREKLIIRNATRSQQKALRRAAQVKVKRSKPKKQIQQKTQQQQTKQQPSIDQIKAQEAQLKQTQPKNRLEQKLVQVRQVLTKQEQPKEQPAKQVEQKVTPQNKLMQKISAVAKVVKKQTPPKAPPARRTPTKGR